MRTRLAAALVGFVAALGLVARPGAAHDIPDRISMHAFVKPEGDHLNLLVRVPLALLINLNLPKRGPGYLELGQLDAALAQAAKATARDLEVLENGAPLAPARSKGRISVVSDRSFESYERALAAIEGPPLPETTDVFWNQGFFDVHLEYPIRSDRSDFAIELHTAPGLGARLTLDVRFLAPDGRSRAYLITGGMGRVALDPRWYQAGRAFVKSGVEHILGGIDHLLFLLCLMIPFRRVGWSLVAVVTSFTVAHSITLLASAYGFVPSGNWFMPLVETLIAVSIVYMAIENLVAPNLSRRWIITGVFGLVHGFGFSFVLKEQLQFAGDHLLLSLLSFNVGVEIGQVLVLAVALPALALLARSATGARFAPPILSVLAGHTAWHWMIERADRLGAVEWPALDGAALVAIARALAALLLAGGVAWWAVSRRAKRALPAGK